MSERSIDPDAGIADDDVHTHYEEFEDLEADRAEWDDGSDEGEDDDLPVCPECHGYLIPLGSLGRVDHFRCRACGADSCIVRGAR